MGPGAVSSDPSDPAGGSAPDPVPGPCSDSAAAAAVAVAASAALDDEAIAAWLDGQPDFFERRPDVLARLALRHAHGGRAVSLIERQVEVLREKNRVLDRRIAELVRTARDNDTILDRLQALVRAMLLAPDAAALPALVEAGLREHFVVPQVALRLWRIDDGRPAGGCAEVEPALIEQTAAQAAPYCGAPGTWLAASLLSERGADTRSIALVPLRLGAHPRPFGLLALGSADTGRFASDLGVAFLARIGEVVSAALAPHAAGA